MDKAAAPDPSGKILERVSPGVLWEPIRIGGLALRNRIVMAALGTDFAEPDGTISERLIDFLARRARGGAGLVVTEATAVDASGVPFPGVPRADDNRYLDGLGRLAAAIRREGAAAALQIYHAGRQMSERISGRQPVAPSAVPSPAVRALPRALEADEVEALVECFAEAAARARAAGFDAVEVNAGHGYLIHQFLSPLANRRDDDWGGDPERRGRFLLEIVRRIRERAGPDFPLLVKVSSEEHAPGGLTLADTVETARALARAGVGAIVASSGTYASFEWLVQPGLAPQGCLRASAAALRRALSIPVVAIGRLQDPAMLEAMIRGGEADLVALGRALLADPDWPRKAQAGDLDAIRPCITCNQCLRRLFGPEPINCAVNPEAGREGEPAPPRAARPRRVVVIGGGPGGMAAAALARERGHGVTLLEAEPELGGRLRAAARVPYHGEMGRLARHLEHRLTALGVEVRLGTRATPEALRSLRPDAVIRATGGRPFVPDVPGARSPHVVSAERCLLTLAPGREAVVVAGDTAVACDVAESLRDAGHAVTLLCPSARGRLAYEAESVTRRALLAALERRRIPVLFEATLEAIHADRVNYRTPEGRASLLARRVVLAFGADPDEAGVRDFAEVAPVVESVGDCWSPGGVLGAIHGAAAAVDRL
jgi:2,4-dienoyl-CoA reductase-like NADH-dependent reductase (Old Yellow Enzyme family)/thioredoxin reductase